MSHLYRQEIMVKSQPQLATPTPEGAKPSSLSGGDGGGLFVV